MNVRIKKLHRDAVTPKYAKLNDGAVDLTAISREDLGNQVVYGTGLAVEIPEGYIGFILPRSSIYKTNLRLTNSIGLIDSGYRGEIKAIFDHTSLEPDYQIGDRIAQLIVMPYPKVTFEVVDKLSETDRGTGGFGSSGS